MDVYYLQGTLKFERIPDLTITNALLKAIIVQALLDLHGEYGASTVVEVIEYKELTKKSYSFVIKIPAGNLVKVWSSLTLLGSYNGVTTMFIVHQVPCDQELMTQSHQGNMKLTICQVSTSLHDLNDDNNQQLKQLFL